MTTFVTKETFLEIIDSRNWGLPETQEKIKSILDNNLL
jgi:hypothetical protein